MTIDELYNEAKNGDLKAKEKLFKKLYARFSYFARQKVWNPDDVEDIVQDTLLVINREYGNIVIETSFYFWAYRVFDLRFLNYLHKKGLNKARYERLPENATDFEYPAANVNSELKIKLLDCLSKIIRVNTRYARILNFHYQGFTTIEICEKLKVTPNNCYSILSRARLLLETCLVKGDIK